MNRTELVDFVANKTGLTKIQSTDALDAVIIAIKETLKDGEEVSLVGFGVFSTGERAARMGRNPRTGEEIPIPASRLPRFKPGKGLKDAVALPKPVAPVKNKAKKSDKTEKVEKTEKVGKSGKSGKVKKG